MATLTTEIIRVNALLIAELTREIDELTPLKKAYEEAVSENNRLKALVKDLQNQLSKKEDKPIGDIEELARLKAQLEGQENK